jgi:molybdopterin-synthase adenylyltransferase
MDRYSRQRAFAKVGPQGQEHLAGARVLIAGCGALGTHVADHLVRAGVGFVRIVDRDFIELHNLQRQSLFDEQDVAEGLPKAEAAARRLRGINSAVQIEAVVSDINPGTVLSLSGDVDLVVDGTDNFETRYLLNEAAVKLDKPWIYGGAIGSEGIVLVVRPGKTPCLRCVFDEAPAPGTTPTCETAGILGPTAAVTAALESVEAIKLLCGKAQEASSGLTTFDLWPAKPQPSFRTLRSARNPACPTCVRFEYPSLTGKAGAHATSLCGRNSVHIAPAAPAGLDLGELEARLAQWGTVVRSKFMLRVTLTGPSTQEALGLTIFPDGRLIVSGTSDFAKARSLYAQYIGS